MNLFVGLSNVKAAILASLDPEVGDLSLSRTFLLPKEA